MPLFQNKKLFWLLVSFICLGILVFWLSSSFFKDKISKEKSPIPNAEVWFLDVGQGDATYLRFDNGFDALIDCGKGGEGLSALARRMSFFDRTLDALIVTHPDLDHYGDCVDILRRYEVLEIYLNGFSKEDAYWQTFLGLVKLETSRITIVSSTLDLKLSEFANLRFLFPFFDFQERRKFSDGSVIESNDSSIVMRLSVFGTDVLLPGDGEEKLEKELLKQYSPDKLQSEILKLGHHGSISSSGVEFLSVVAPKEVVASAGRNNRYGHPSLRVLRRAERVGARTWRTDQNGDIVLNIYPDKYEIFGDLP